METPSDYFEAAARLLLYVVLAMLVIVVLGRLTPTPTESAHPVYQRVARTVKRLGLSVEDVFIRALAALGSAIERILYLLWPVFHTANTTYELIQSKFNQALDKLRHDAAIGLGWLFFPFTWLAKTRRWLIQHIERAVARLATHAAGVLTFLAALLAAAAKWVGRAALQFFRLVSRLLARPVGAAYRLFLSAGSDLIQSLRLALRFVAGVLSKLRPLLGVVAGWLQSLLAVIGRPVTKLWQVMQGVLGLLWRTVGTVLALLWLPFAGLWRIIQWLSRLAAKTVRALAGFGRAIGTWVSPLFVGTGRLFGRVVHRLAQPLLVFFKWLAITLVGLGRPVRSLSQQIWRAMSHLVASISRLIARTTANIMTWLRPPLALTFKLLAWPFVQFLDTVYRLDRSLRQRSRVYVPVRNLILLSSLAYDLILVRQLYDQLIYVRLEIWTNDTKAEWVTTVTETFNEAQYRTRSGRIIVVQVEQASSGDIFPMILAGKIRPVAWSPGESSWINEANDRWQASYGRPLSSEPCPQLVYTAIGIGMWQPMAAAIGWPDTPISWDDIVELAVDPQGWTRYDHPEWGTFKFGHTHPASSNTGLLALTSLAYSVLDKTEGLTPELVRSAEVVDAFQRLEEHTYHYGVSTRSLFTTMAERGPAYLHAGTNSEIGVMATNFYQKDLLRWPLVFIFPAEGTFWSDNPFCILDAGWVSAEEREAAEIYQAYLLGDEAQQTAIEEWLRPRDASFTSPQLPAEWQYTDLSITPEEVPPVASISGETQAAILDVFNQAKKPSTVLILLDTSASMGGNKLRRAVEGTVAFLQLLLDQDEVLIYQFDTDVSGLQPSGRIATVRHLVEASLRKLQPRGKTSLFDAICTAVQRLEEVRLENEQAGRQSLYGIVLLSDGEDTSSQRSLEQMTECLPSGEDVAGVKIFTIAYGNDADKALLAEIARQTNGRFYTGAPENIEEVYRQISFEQ